MGKKPIIGITQEDSKLFNYKDLHWGKYSDCAVVYFRNNESDLDINDIGLLTNLRERFKSLLENRCWVFLDCHGYASAPGQVDYNSNLSRLRCESVLDFFGNYLGGYKRYITGKKFYGEKNARPERNFHDLDRKVVVRVKLVSGRDPAYGEYERWYFTRVKIFMNYSPVYREWRNRGLFYLVEEYEKLWEYREEDQLVIRKEDLDKVFEILQVLLNSHELNALDFDLRKGDKFKVIHEYYHLVYRREYHIAYDKFSKVSDPNEMARIMAHTY